MTPNPFTEAEKAARFAVENRHQFQGTQCTCGFESARSRSRTGHVLSYYFYELATLRAAAQEDDGHDGWCGCGCQDAQEESDVERAVRELHRRFGVYEHEDSCPDTSDEHREAHHHEDADDAGEYYCDQRPLYTLCDHCRDEDGERLDWPCPTVRALDSARADRRDEEKRSV